MGLASKLAAANNAASTGSASPYPTNATSQTQSAYGAPTQQTGQYGQPFGTAQQPPSQYGQQAPSQYGQATAAPPQQPPRWTYGYGQPPAIPYTPPQSQASAYGAPPAPGPRPGQASQGQYGQPPHSQYGQPPQGQYGQTPQGQYGQPQSQYGQPQSQYGQPQGQYGQPQSQYGQGQYGQPSGAPGGYGQPGQRPGPQATGYGQQQPVAQGSGQPQGNVSYDAILQILIHTVNEQKIGAFYGPGTLEPIAQRIVATNAIQRIASEWKLVLEIAVDLVKLALFDVILYLDDSGSMSFEEGGSRIDDLKLIVQRASFAASLFDDDGIQVRFMNSPVDGNGIKSDAQVADLISRVRFSGLTPLGTALNQKILEPLVIGPARAGSLRKPVLIIAVTDGAPGGEDRNTLSKVIKKTKNALTSTRYGPDTVSFQLAQVGNDLKARAFLEEIDENPEIGGLVDTTSNYENEADNMAKANPPFELTPDLWIVKLLLGGIDDSYDSKDQ